MRWWMFGKDQVKNGNDGKAGFNDLVEFGFNDVVSLD